MKPKCRPSIINDCYYLAPRLRYADLREVNTLNQTALQALLTGFQACQPHNVHTILDRKGSPVGMFGVSRASDEVGIPWLLASKGLEGIQIPFLRECRSIVGDMNAIYPVLENFIDGRNTLHLRWIEWCGFTIVEDIFIEGIPFHKFRRT